MSNQMDQGNTGNLEKVQFLPFLIRCLRNWWLFAGFIGLAAYGGNLYLQSAVPRYQATASILIQKDNKSDLVASSTFGLEDPFLLDRGLLADDIEVLKSRKLAEEVVRNEQLNILYFVGGPSLVLGLVENTQEISREESPVAVQFLDSLEAFYDYSFLLTPSEGKEVNVEIRTIAEGGFNSIGTIQAKYGKQVEFEGKKLIFYARGEINDFLMINVANPKKLAFSYAGRVQIVAVPRSNVLTISIDDNISSRAVLSTNALIAEYDAYILRNKNLSANRTLEFIDSRLSFITNELFEVEKELEEFKRNNDIPIELSARAIQFIGDVSENDKAIADLDIRLEILKGVKSELEKTTGSDFDYILLNPNLTGQSPALVNEYNTALQRRNALLSSATRENPTIKTLDVQLAAARRNIRTWVGTTESDLRSQRDFMMRQSEPISNKLDALPKYEREMIEIMREKGIKEALFTYLLQRKEETSMTLASEVSKLQIINEPFLNGLIWPSKKKVYLIFLVFGLSIPLIIVFLKDYFDNKIYSLNDIQSITDTPVLGEVPIAPKGEAELKVAKGSRSVIAEVFRHLRTNLQFLGKSNIPQTILITSSTGGEGKTFVSINLAASIAISGKSVVLVGMDLRKPRLSEYLTGTTAEKGVTNYLIDKNTGINDLLQQVEGHDSLFYIDSGPIPPNPNELLMGEETRELFRELKEKFDHIIVDSSPIGLVADSLTLKDYVEATVYVTKFKFTNKHQLYTLEDIYKNKKLPNPTVILNGLKRNFVNRYGTYHRYGYSYSYGYYDEEKPNWFKRTLKKLRGK